MRTPPTTAPTTVPVLTDPSITTVDDVVRVVELDNMMVLDTVDNKVFVVNDIPDAVRVIGVSFLSRVVENVNSVAVVDIVILVEYGSNGDETDNVDDNTDGNKVSSIVE